MKLKVQLVVCADDGREEQVQEVATFTSALIQADELGMGIARPLASQAQQMRVRRRQRAEKMAHEASVSKVGYRPVRLFCTAASTSS